MAIFNGLVSFLDAVPSSRTQKCNKELWNYRGCELNGKQSEWVQAKVWIIVDGATICCQLRIVHVPEQIKNAGTGISVVGVMHFIIIIVGILFFCFPVNTWPSACLPACLEKEVKIRLCWTVFVAAPELQLYIVLLQSARVGLSCGWVVGSAEKHLDGDYTDCRKHC